jgi:hypothetical protein
MNSKYADEESVARIVEACIGIQNGELSADATPILRSNAYKVLLMSTIVRAKPEPKVVFAAKEIAKLISPPLKQKKAAKSSAELKIHESVNTRVTYAAATSHATINDPYAPLAAAASGVVPVVAAAGAAYDLMKHDPTSVEEHGVFVMEVANDAWIASVETGIAAVHQAVDTVESPNPEAEKSLEAFRTCTVLDSKGKPATATPAQKLRAYYAANPSSTRHPFIALAAVVPFAEWHAIVTKSKHKNRQSVLAVRESWATAGFADWNNAGMVEVEAAVADL